jgi:hypothetical protein
MRGINIVAALFFFSLCFPADAQQAYYKIPTDTNHFWKQRSVCSDHVYQVRWAKDTLINSMLYHKFSRFGPYGINTPCASFIRDGYIRQDSMYQVVYLMDYTMKESCIYNFMLNTGDSMMYYDRFTNTHFMLHIDSTGFISFADGVQRKYQWVSGYHYRNLFIMGMGSAFGGLYAHNQKSQSAFNITEELICFGQVTPFQPLYTNNPSYDCAVMYSGLKSERITETEIRPSVSEEVIDILTESPRKVQIKIYDISGHEILSEGMQIPEQLDVRGLSRGLYFISISASEGRTNYRFVKN